MAARLSSATPEEPSLGSVRVEVAFGEPIYFRLHVLGEYGELVKQCGIHGIF